MCKPEFLNSKIDPSQEITTITRTITLEYWGGFSLLDFGGGVHEAVETALHRTQFKLGNTAPFRMP